MNIPGTVEDTVCFIFIDTTTLAPSEERNCNEEGGISTDTQAARIADQLVHVEQMLIAAENSTWVVVCGHYPIYTSGEHGDSSELVTYLQPLIAKYNVSMYLAGHDHLSGHLQHEGIEYFIAGGGAMVDPLGDDASVATDVWYGVGYAAFSVLQVTSNTLAMKFIHWNGTEMYHYTLRNPRRNATLFSMTQPPSAALTAAPSAGPGTGRSSRTLTFPKVSPPLLYIAVAAGSLTGLMLSILFFPFDKRKKTKRKGSGKKSKKYSSLPATPHRLELPSTDSTQSPSTRSPVLTQALDTHVSGSAHKRNGRSRPRAELPLRMSPDLQHQPQRPDERQLLQQVAQRHLSSPHGNSPACRFYAPSPARTDPWNPFSRTRRGLTGDNLVRKLSTRENFSSPPVNTPLQVDHRKTKSEDPASSVENVHRSPKRLEAFPSFELGL